MSPLIDMIFILLIFFVVTTSFVKESGVDIDRPVARTAQEKVSTNLVIGVTADNVVYIEGRSIDVRSVQSYMERFLMENPSGSVVIAADKKSHSGVVIQVLDACRLAGGKNISVAARRSEA
jgi:biopolymer transport protein ExbD